MAAATPGGDARDIQGVRLTNSFKNVLIFLAHEESVEFQAVTRCANLDVAQPHLDRIARLKEVKTFLDDARHKAAARKKNRSTDTRDKSSVHMNGTRSEGRKRPRSPSPPAKQSESDEDYQARPARRRRITVAANGADDFMHQLDLASGEVPEHDAGNFRNPAPALNIEDKQLQTAKAKGLIISESHPTVIPAPDGKGFVELRCYLCGANCSSQKLRFFVGSQSLKIHLGVVHKITTNHVTADPAFVARTIQRCVHKRLSDDEVRRIQAGDENAYAVEAVPGTLPGPSSARQPETNPNMDLYSTKMKSIGPSHPTVVQHPDGNGYVELRCYICGANYSPSRNCFFSSASAFVTHLQKSHQIHGSSNPPVPSDVALQLCMTKRLTQAQSKGIRAGNRNAYIVPVVTQQAPKRHADTAQGITLPSTARQGDPIQSEDESSDESEVDITVLAGKGKGKAQIQKTDRSSSPEEYPFAEV